MSGNRHCSACAHYRPGAIFELCAHPQATYKVAEKADQRTVGHMRGNRGACGEFGNLYELKPHLKARVGA